jgi:hypothetical protein
MHNDSRVIAFATRVKSSGDNTQKLTFAWQSIGKPSTGLATALAEVAEAAGLKPPPALPAIAGQFALEAGVPPQWEILEATLPEAGLRQKPVHVAFCPVPKGPIAQYRSVVQSSDALPGGVINGHLYSVSAKLGDGTPPDTSGGTWEGDPGHGQRRTLRGERAQDPGQQRDLRRHDGLERQPGASTVPLA